MAEDAGTVTTRAVTDAVTTQRLAVASPPYRNPKTRRRGWWRLPRHRMRVSFPLELVEASGPPLAQSRKSRRDGTVGNPLSLPLVASGPGFYAVPDPDDSWRLTAWSVDRQGLLHRYPTTQRWEPEPPTFAEIGDRFDRKDARDRWYLETYRPWKVAIVNAINADPVAAAEAFTRAYPTVLADMKAAKEASFAERLRRAKLVDDMVIAALVARGESISAAARRVGLARSTVRDRIANAHAAVATRPAMVRDALVEHVEPSAREHLPPADAGAVDLEAFVDRFLVDASEPDAKESAVRDELGDALRELFRRPRPDR